MFDDETGYGLSDPKHPTYTERYAAYADDERKRRRERGEPNQAVEGMCADPRGEPVCGATRDAYVCALPPHETGGHFFRIPR